MGDAALQAALARAARAPGDPETWRELTRAIRPLGSSWEALTQLATTLASVRGEEHLEGWWRGVMRSAGWVAGEPSPPVPEGPFVAWTLAPDGARVAAAREGGVVLWESPWLSGSREVPAPPGEVVEALGFVAGTLRAFTGGRRRLALWDLVDEDWQLAWEAEAGGLVLASCLRRGRLAWMEEGSLQVRGPELQEEIPPPEGSDALPEAAAFSPDGDVLATMWGVAPGEYYGQTTMELNLVQLGSGLWSAPRTLVLPPSPNLAFSRGGGTLGVGGSRGGASHDLWTFPVTLPLDLGEGKEHRTPLLRGLAPGDAEGELVALGQAVSGWRHDEGLVTTSPGLGAGTLEVAGARTLLGREDGFDLLDGRDGTLVTRAPGTLIEAGFMPSRDQLWTLDDRQVLRTWAWPGGGLLRARPLWQSHCLPWGGGGYTATFTPIYHEVRNLETGAVEHRLYHPEDGMVVDNWRLADVSPGGDALLLASDTRRLRCIDAATGRSRWRRRLPGADFGPVAYLPGPASETILAVIRDPARAFELDAGSGETRREWRLPDEFDWTAGRWRPDLGGPAPALFGPGAVLLEPSGQVTVLQSPHPSPCASSRDRLRRARFEEGHLVVEARRPGDGWSRVQAIALAEPPGLLLLTPGGDGLLWADGAALAYRELPGS
jgi:hypothetical protein